MGIPTTYSELQTEIIDWTKRSDMAARVPLFIAMGESAMNSRLRLRSMETAASVTLSSGASTATLPTDFLEPISLAYSDSDNLRQYPQNELDNARAYLSTTSAGRPDAFAYGSTTIIFNRNADQNYTLTLRYFKKLDLATDLSNTVLTLAPYAYLYGALQAYANWTEDGEGLSKYTQLFQQELKQLEHGDMNSRGRANLRSDLPEILGSRIFDITTG